MEGHELIEVVSLSAAFAAVVLAVGALWLAFRCYRVTMETAARTAEAARIVAASTVKLEQLLSAISPEAMSAHAPAPDQTACDEVLKT